MPTANYGAAPGTRTEIETYRKVEPLRQDPICSEVVVPVVDDTMVVFRSATATENRQHLTETSARGRGGIVALIHRQRMMTKRDGGDRGDTNPGPLAMSMMGAMSADEDTGTALVIGYTTAVRHRSETRSILHRDMRKIPIPWKTL